MKYVNDVRITGRVFKVWSEGKYPTVIISTQKTVKDKKFYCSHTAVTFKKDLVKTVAELQKDQWVSISGEMISGSYEDRNGKKIYTYKVSIEELDLLADAKPDPMEGLRGNNNTKKFEMPFDESDIPF